MPFHFCRYGQRQWTNKETCWGIQEFFCDLTNETSAIQEPYYGRVKTALAGIHSGWTMTRRFIPWWESEFHAFLCILSCACIVLRECGSPRAPCLAEVHGFISFGLILQTALEDGFPHPHYAAQGIKAGALAGAQAHRLHNPGRDSNSAASDCRAGTIPLPGYYLLEERSLFRQQKRSHIALVPS